MNSLWKWIVDAVVGYLLKVVIGKALEWWQDSQNSVRRDRIAKAFQKADENEVQDLQDEIGGLL